MQAQTLESHAELAVATRSPAWSFRSDIQGIRALAILFVVACHAVLPGFSGGYVGVDMFFVISGYLITGLLLREAMANEGRIDLLRFYARRCKRLVPAFLLVTGLTLLLARIALSPAEQVQQGGVASWVSLWFGNVHFSLSDLDYFAPEAASNLFLHTWSLSVEEQFYLLWPFLIGALYMQYRQEAGGDQDVWRHLQKGLLIILAASLLLCLYWSYRAPRLGFYMMPSRAWQFALGGLVFLMTQRNAGQHGTVLLQRLRMPLGFAGLAAIVLAVLWLDERMTYPGFLALMPTAGTALLLFAGGAPGASPLTRILGWRGLQWLGDLSYSWYLWHWPVLVFGGLLFGAEAGYALKVTLIALSLALAAVTYYTVEAPVRSHAGLSGRPVTVLCLALAAMVGMACAGQWLEARASQDAVSPEQLPFRQVKGNLPVLYSGGCDEWFSSSRVVACVYGNEQAEHTAVLIGDSIGAQWFSALAVPLTQAGWRFVVYTKSACPIVDEPIFYVRIMQVYENCALWRQQLPSSVAKLNADLVFIGSAGSYDYSAQQWREGTARVLDQLAPLARQLFVISPTPALPFDGPDCLARQAWQPRWLGDMSTCSSPLQTHDHESARLGLEAAIAQHDNVRMLDLTPLVCPDGRCSAGRDGGLVYRDTQHLADVFVAKQAPGVFERMLAASDPDVAAAWKPLAR